MNERIEQLAEQADDYAYKQYAKKSSGHDREYFFKQKFAELIVRECAGAANDWYQNHEQLHWDPATHILAHFGVE